MLIDAVRLASIALAVHIAAVAVAFAPLFAFPVLVAAVRRSDPNKLAAVYRVQDAVARRVITPALPAVLIAGLYLAADQHVFGKAWVIIPMVVIVVLMALHRLVLLEGYRRLASRDGSAGPSGESRLARRVEQVQLLSAALVVFTIIVMSAKPVV
jgi:predicted integral membrane protein DUF2269